MADQENVIADYRGRAAAFRERARAVERALRLGSTLRLIAFLGLVLLLADAAAHWSTRSTSATFSTLLIGAGIVAVVFLALVAYTARLRARRHYWTSVADLNDQAAARAERDWPHIVQPPWEPDDDPADGDGDTAMDLDIFGSRSLVQLLPPLSTAPGRARVRAWLTAPAPVDDIRQRQEGVRELAPNIDFRDRLAAAALRLHGAPRRVHAFVAWAAAERTPQPAWMHAGSIVLPVATIALIVLQVLGVTASPLWLAPVVLTGLLSSLARARIKAALDPAAGMADTATAYMEAFEIVERERFVSRQLLDIQHRLAAGDGAAASGALRRLANIAAAAQVRASPMAHALLQLGLLWDWHVARQLDRWRGRFGPAVPRWFDALGDAEGLAAFAALAHANPDWTFPDVVDLPADTSGDAQIVARALGHPLLPSAARVANDVTVGPPGRVQVISGSNMSGKSTLLRAVGLNVVLAQAGAPVCAASMRCPVLHVRTSIRVHDSLHEGISYFMAELRRLRQIVAVAEAPAPGGTGRVLYLIDEMLRGTNAEERAVATRLVVERLLATPAVGVITTHDAATFDKPPLAASVQHLHFQESFAAGDGQGAGERMYFDYRLHDGPATSTNALRLLALVGIVPPPEA